MDRVTFNPSKFTKVGTKFDTSSGLGGSFSIEFIGMKDGNFLFRRNAVNDWPEATYTFTAEQVAMKVYILIPDKHERLMLTEAARLKYEEILKDTHINSVERY